jgi:hypothetical protein
MASRRLEGDPFFTEHFNAETYSPEGFKRIQEIESLKDLLKHHMPDLAVHCKPTSAFKLWQTPDPRPGVCARLTGSVIALFDCILFPLKLLLACLVSMVMPKPSPKPKPKAKP